jgi:hypothetical protein
MSREARYALACALGLFVPLLIALLVAVRPAHAGYSAADRAACTPDAMRLCSAEMPDVRRVVACMSAHAGELSQACRAAFDRHNAPHQLGRPTGHVRRAVRPAAEHVVVPSPRPRPAPPDPPQAAAAEVASPPADLRPAISSAPVPSSPPPPPPVQPKGHPMLTTITNALGAMSWSTIVLLALAAYFAVKNGVPSVIAFLKRMWGYATSGYATVKADLAAIEARVSAIETAVKPAAPAAPAAQNATPAAHA